VFLRGRCKPNAAVLQRDRSSRRTTSASNHVGSSAARQQGIETRKTTRVARAGATRTRSAVVNNELVRAIAKKGPVEFVYEESATGKCRGSR
jgi:hypothetical protein